MKLYKKFHFFEKRNFFAGISVYKDKKHNIGGNLMKRKYLCGLLVCLLIAFTMIGCAKEDVNENETGNGNENSSVTNEELNLETLFQEGMDSYTAAGLEPPVLFPESDPGYLENFYPGIGNVAFEQIYVAMAPVTNAPMEIALVEVKEASDVEVIRDIFQQRIDDRANDSAYPEESAVWKNNGIVTTRGNYVFMAVMTDDYGIPEVFILD